MSYDWLPDHHVGVAATLAHADEVISQIGDLVFEYQSQPNGILTLSEVLRVTFSQTVVTGIAPLPRKLPLLVADALGALRNAIEHTLFAEIEDRDGRLNENQAKKVEMPASMSYRLFEGWISQRSKKAPPALIQGSELLKRIEALQPFQRTIEPENHPMALLAAHTNHAKHRAPTITAVRLAAMYFDDQMPRSVAESERPSVPLTLGEVIAETPLGQRRQANLFPSVGINRPGSNSWPELMRELGDIAHWVRTQAIPRLITGAAPPQPALPAWYPITVGHDVERDALLAGTEIPAAQRAKDHMGAVLARKEFAGLLASMDGAPSKLQIDAWFDSLTDLEVLERVERVKFSADRDLEILMRNVASLEALLEEVRAFLQTDR